MAPEFRSVLDSCPRMRGAVFVRTTFDEAPLFWHPQGHVGLVSFSGVNSGRSLQKRFSTWLFSDGMPVREEK